MIEFLTDIDTSVFLFFNGLHNDFFDRFMMAFTGKTVWIPMYVTMAVMLFRRYNWRIASGYLIAIGLAILVTDQMIASHIRPFFERLRPSHVDSPVCELVHVVNGYRGGLYGFPSCHGANSFCLAVFLSLLVRERRFAVAVFSWAVLHSYTRLYLGVHYPGDLLVGAILGSCIGAVMYCASRFLSRRMMSAGNFPVMIDETIKLGNKSLTFLLSDMVVAVMLLTTIAIIAYSFNF